MNSVKKTFLNYELTPHQDAILNYLLPSVCSCVLYILVLSSDVGVVFRHYKDNNPIWASVTLFIIFVPSLASYIVTVSDWLLWPEIYGCGKANFLWFLSKTGEHVMFPVWAIWRFAECIFWSIEAVRSSDEKDIEEAKSIVTAPRTIEFYFFLQSFLHSLPQILIQLNILMSQNTDDLNRQSVDAVIMSSMFNLAKIATTIAFYQRFKSQKMTGKQYPWFKPYKYKFEPGIIPRAPKEEGTEAQNPGRDEVDGVETNDLPEDMQQSDSRRSSDLYMTPSTPLLKRLRDVFDAIKAKNRESTSTVITGTPRQTSILDGHERKRFIDQPDFNIKRVTAIKGLPEDDLAGKLVAFIWWFLFLMVRILSITTFHYFYPTATYCILSVHLVVVFAYLVYDTKSDKVQRAKAVFFLFLSLIFIFCVIEFKVKFKKAKFIYYGYFILAYVETFTMIIIWWVRNIEDLRAEYWFRFTFYLTLGGSILSLTAMLFYLNVNKPGKVVVEKKIVQ